MTTPAATAPFLLQAAKQPAKPAKKAGGNTALIAGIAAGAVAVAGLAFALLKPMGGAKPAPPARTSSKGASAGSRSVASPACPVTRGTRSSQKAQPRALPDPL